MRDSFFVFVFVAALVVSVVVIGVIESAPADPGVLVYYMLHVWF